MQNCIISANLRRDDLNLQAKTARPMKITKLQLVYSTYLYKSLITHNHQKDVIIRHSIIRKPAQLQNQLIKYYESILINAVATENTIDTAKMRRGLLQHHY